MYPLFLLRRPLPPHLPKVSAALGKEMLADLSELLRPVESRIISAKHRLMLGVYHVSRYDSRKICWMMVCLFVLFCIVDCISSLIYHCLADLAALPMPILPALPSPADLLF